MCLGKAAPVNITADATQLAQQLISWEELARHTTEDSLWVSIDGAAYNLSRWAENHPGGAQVLLHSAGRDATDAFIAYHPANVHKQLKFFRVGVMESAAPHLPPPDTSVAHTRLRDQLMAEGMFGTRPQYYVRLAAWLVLLYGAVWWCVLHKYLTPGALLLSLFWQQIAFVGHDAGHCSITHIRKWDNCIGWVVTSLVGISISCWKAEHNVHHVVPNSLDCDPDVQHLPILATSPTCFNSLFSKFRNQVMSFDSVSRQLVNYQHFTFLPLLMVAKFRFYIVGAIQLLDPKARFALTRRAEALAFLVYFGWLGLLLAQVPSWPARVAFCLLSHAGTVLLHLQIVCSHFPMPKCEGLPAGDWLTGQVTGTMNWSCPAWLDWFHGGLQFQVEHHVFPRIPRHNLRAVSSLLRPECERLGLAYHSPPFFGALRLTLADLRNTAMQCRALDAKAA